MPDHSHHQPRKDLADRDLKWLREHQAEVERARKKLEARAERLGVRIEDLRDDRTKTREQAKDKRQREREFEEAIAKARGKRLWEQRGCIDDCTTWLGLKLVLNVVAAKTDWNGGVNAADRTEAHADDCGDKMSQAELYWGWVHGLPGFFPANPPGTGSHEGICDDDLARLGFGSIGSKLKAHQWGLDLQDGPVFEAGADHLGFVVVRAYPNESWHVNIKADPTPVLKRLGVI